jgi:hypothetical protein
MANSDKINLRLQNLLLADVEVHGILSIKKLSESYSLVSKCNQPIYAET